MFFKITKDLGPGSNEWIDSRMHNKVSLKVCPFSCQFTKCKHLRLEYAIFVSLEYLQARYSTGASQTLSDKKLLTLFILGGQLIP